MLARLLLLVVPLLALCGAASSSASTIVVLPIGGDEALTAEVRVALADLGTVQSADATADNVAAARALGIRCDASLPACIAELGAVMNGDLVVGGAAAPAVGGTAVTLRLVRVASGTEVRSASLVVPGTQPGRKRALRQLAVRTVDPSRDRGRVTIVVTPADAEVFVDGARLAPAQRGQPLSLSTGQHELYAARVGHESISELVDVAIDDDIAWVKQLPREGGAPEPDAALPDRPGREPGRERVAVIAVDGDGFDPALRQELGDAVAIEIGKLKGIVVTDLDDVAGHLDQQTSIMLRCPEPACHTLIAEKLDVDSLVDVIVAREDDRVTLLMRRFDGPTGALLSESKQVSLVHGAKDAEVGALVAPAVRLTFPLVPLRDGEVRGHGPLVVLDGEQARPPLPPSVFWTAVVATAATTTAATATTVLSVGFAGTPSEDALVGVSWAAWGVTAGLVVADVALFFLTDWE